jgi:hypothetical protein
MAFEMGGNRPFLVAADRLGITARVDGNPNTTRARSFGRAQDFGD